MAAPASDWRWPAPEPVLLIMDDPQNPSTRPRILVVDDSRMVRASLVKHLREHYDCREEVDGDAAWQTLVLDPTIQLVISDLSMPVLDGFGLLDRIRQSKLGRVRQLPVIVISGDEDDAAKARAKELGANDFITKGIGTVELQTRVASLMRLGAAQTQLENTEAALEASREEQLRDPVTGLFTRRTLEVQAEQAISLARRQKSPVSFLVLGFDHLNVLTAKHGAGLLAPLQGHFAKMLTGQVRQEDSLGHFSGEAFAIVSPGTPGESAVIFAERLRAAVEASHVAVHGQRLPLTVSVGVACFPDDGGEGVEALLQQAVQRMEGARAEGGNRVWAPPPVEAAAAEAPIEVAIPALGPPPDLEQALAMLGTGEEEGLRPHADALAKALLPLLSFLNYELQLGIPVGELEQRLKGSVSEPTHAGHTGDSTQMPDGDHKS